MNDWDGLTDYEVKRADMLAHLGYAVFALDRKEKITSKVSWRTEPKGGQFWLLASFVANIYF